MNVLLVNPGQPDTFFNYRHALRFIGKKAALPPLGLLTVAAMLPVKWPKKVVDMVVEPLNKDHLAWADVVFISAMIVQKESALEVIDRCSRQGLTVVAGGPLFNHMNREINGVDHFVIGEAEEVLPVFLADFEAGRAKRVYRAQGHPELTLTPIPAWELVKLRYYHGLSVQFTRGCPFDCEFCDIVRMFGRKVRFKSPRRVLAELERLHSLGWRGGIMFVDDNFIGHKGKARELLRAIISWQQSRGYPFIFNTQASVNLAGDPETMSLMNRANMTGVFLGIETPSRESLAECGKRQNQAVDMVDAVKTIQGHGLIVSGGFIIGFDSDPDSIFDDQVRFIEQAAIPTAMVGLLSVGEGTRLFDRLAAEGRLLGQPSGNNTADAGALNFIPKMDRAKLLAGYRTVLKRLYEPKAYYRRVWKFLRQRGPTHVKAGVTGLADCRGKALAAVRIFWRLGVLEPGRRAFWAYILKVIFRQPKKLVSAVNFAAVGYHFKRITASFIGGGEASQAA